MDHFHYRNGRLHAEDVPVDDIAQAVGTPCYIYSRATLERHWHAFDDALGEHPHRVCYAVKANSNLAVLACLARLGSGFDIVSGGELLRVLAAGGRADRIVFSGVGKGDDELRLALDHGIHCFNVESEAELHRLDSIAREQGKTAPVALRVNPDIDPQTHPYISTGLKENKFGIDIHHAEALYRRAAELPGIRLRGVACHIGSQILELSPFLEALDRVLTLVDRLHAAGIPLEHLDIGGGLGIRYRDEHPPEPREYARLIKARLAGRALALHIEPGRAIAGNAGILLTRVRYLKQGADRRFAIVDAAMNDLLRPALYQAWQEIIPVLPRNAGKPHRYDIVGPVCETADFLGKDRELNIEPGDLLAVRSAGAYGFTMSSNYNSRPRAPEVLVDGESYHLIRERETFEDLIRGERIPPL